MCATQNTKEAAKSKSRGEGSYKTEGQKKGGGVTIKGRTGTWIKVTENYGSKPFDFTFYFLN